MSQEHSPPRTSAALRSATGRDYADWFRLLDAWGASTRGYREVASWLTGEHGLSRWWAQKLVVEYEQSRGIREAGARPGGTFAGGASKTVAVPVERLFEAFTNPQVRDQWLAAIELSERTARSNRSARFDCGDGSRLSVNFDSMGENRSQVAVEQEHLPNAGAAQQARSDWQERLTRLKTLLES